MFCRLVKMSFLWLFSSPFPCLDSSTRLLSSKTRLWKHGLSAFSLRLLSIFVVASSVDSSTRVSWMLRQCLVTRRRCYLDCQARSRGNKEPKQYSTKPPYSSDGGRTYSLARKSTNVTFKVRNVQPLLNHPNTQSHVQGNLNHILIITDYNKSCNCVPYLSH